MWYWSVFYYAIRFLELFSFILFYGSVLSTKLVWLPIRFLTSVIHLLLYCNILSYHIVEIITYTTTHTTSTVLRPFVRDYPGEPVPEETLTHPPSCSSSNLYQLLPSTTIHSILLVHIPCLAIFLHNFFPCPVWSTSWSGALHLIFHTFLHPISVFFLHHMPIPSQPVLL